MCFTYRRTPRSGRNNVLRLRPRDIAVIFDFRRYQASLERLAASVRARKSQTIVITDPWISPAAKGATELVAAPIDSGTLWDSYVPAFALVEALLVRLAERNWGEHQIADRSLGCTPRRATYRGGLGVSEHLSFVGTSDISGILRGKSFPASQWERRSKRGVGWTPTNVQITCFDTIAESPVRLVR